MLLIQNTTTTNTFDFWRQRTNEMAVAFSNCVITTDANTSSTAATGNAAITGDFTANSFLGNNTIKVSNSSANAILTKTTFYLGNSSVNINVSANVMSLSNTYTFAVGNSSVNVVTNCTSIKISNSSSNLAITVPTSSQVLDGGYYLSSNGTWDYLGIGALISTGSETSITSAARVVDTYAVADFRSAEYIVTVSDNSANNKMSSKIMTMHDGGIAYLTEYAQLISNNNIGYFTISVSGTNVVLQFVPSVSQVTVKFTRTTVPI